MDEWGEDELLLRNDNAVKRPSTFKIRDNSHRRQKLVWQRKSWNETHKTVDKRRENNATLVLIVFSNKLKLINKRILLTAFAAANSFEMEFCSNVTHSMTSLWSYRSKIPLISKNRLPNFRNEEFKNVQELNPRNSYKEGEKGNIWRCLWLGGWQHSE
jgi:hypothetical protein